jgi:hypothetical protein
MTTRVMSLSKLTPLWRAETVRFRSELAPAVGEERRKT